MPSPFPIRNSRSSRSPRSPRSAERFGIPLIVDNTAAPLIIRPLEHGAAVVVYSTTKYIGGHGTSIGGAIVDGGNFPWKDLAERFPTLHEPDPSYHQKNWIEKAAAIDFHPYILRVRAVLLRDIGAAISPQSAFQFIQGLETLPLPAKQRERRQGCRISRKSLEGREGHLSEIPDGCSWRTGKEISASGLLWRPRRLRVERRPRGGPPFHRRTSASLPRRQYWRRSLAGDPSIDHDAFSTQPRGTARHWRHPRLCPPVHRHRTPRRHYRRHRRGAGSSLIPQAR